MAVRVQKSAVNIREKLAELERPIGINGAALMATNTPQEAFSLIGAGRKNMIINGDMRIDQRNSGSAITTPNIGIAVDRWKCATYVTGTTIQRSTTAPPGFVNSYLMTNGTAAAPAQSTYYQQIWHHIEGYNIAHLAWGTSSAKPISISFWVRSSAPGLYSFGLGNGTDPSIGDHNRSFCQTFTINSANTWEYKTFTVPGCPSGTWATGNTHGITIAFNLGSGTAYDTNSPGVWSSSSTRLPSATSSTIEFNNITGATFYLTGVQLEEGKIATPFEFRSFGGELALCSRYYQKSYPYEIVPGANCTTNGLAFAGMVGRTGLSGVTTSGEVFLGTKLYPTMRATPSITFYDRSGNVSKVTGTNYLVQDVENLTASLKDSCSTGFQVGIYNVGTFGGISYHYTASAEL